MYGTVGGGSPAGVRELFLDGTMRSSSVSGSLGGVR